MKSKILNVLKNDIFGGNPVLRLILGIFPALFITTTALNGIGMGIATTIVLICFNLVISLIYNLISEKIRIPAYITIITGFVCIAQMLVKAFAPSLEQSIGIFLPLIVVNCIILARAKTFESKNPVLPSVLDALGMGIGFTITLTLIGAIRQLLGASILLSFQITANVINPMIILAVVSVLLAGILTSNAAQTKLLCLGADKKINTAFYINCAATLVTTITTAVTWPIYNFILKPLSLNYLQTVVFILVIIAFVQLLEILTKKFIKPVYDAVGAYLPLITTICAVLGITMLGIIEDYNFGRSLINALGVGLGFMLAMLLFVGVRSRTETADVPEFLKGLPITLIAAAIIAFSFLGFANLGY